MRALRRQYTDILGDRVARGDVRGLFDLALRFVGTALSPRHRRPLAGPALGTLLVTYRCDLRCAVCDLPQRAAARRRAGDRELDTAEFKDVLRDMRAIGTAGVGVTGGEPMLRKDLPELLRHGADLGLHMHLNTDGLFVEERALDLVRAGVRSINISLDGATAEIHDAARGRAGSFDRVLRSFQALKRAQRPGQRPRLTAVTVLTPRNIHQIGDVVDVACEAGAERVGVIPVHDFGHGESEMDPELLAEGLRSLAALHDQGLIDNSTAYLDLIPRAFRGESSPLKCYAPYASVVVDCYGDVYPCFPLMERRQPKGRIPLAPLWRSAAYQAERDALSACTACLWNCHTEMNLALPQPGAARAALREAARGGSA